MIRQVASRHLLAQLALLSQLALVAAACSHLPAPLEEALADPVGEPLIVATEEGGLCAIGTCTSGASFFGDGVVVRSDGTRDRVPADEWGRLTEAIAATPWDEVLARPFTGTCPQAFDGTEITFEIRTPGGPVTVASCEVEIDWASEPFAGLARWLHDDGR